MKLELIDSLKTGHTDIDGDHAEIIATINTITHMAKGDGDLSQMPALLERFVRICEAHFQNEECILAQAGYPYLGEHSAYHSQMLANADAARLRFGEAQNQENRLKHIEEMIGFLVDDILSSDMTFVSFLQARGLAQGRP